jgi:hypothetical protein
MLIKELFLFSTGESNSIEISPSTSTSNSITTYFYRKKEFSQFILLLSFPIRFALRMSFFFLQDSHELLACLLKKEKNSERAKFHCRDMKQCIVGLK